VRNVASLFLEGKDFQKQRGHADSSDANIPSQGAYCEKRSKWSAPGIAIEFSKNVDVFDSRDDIWSFL